MTLFHWWQSPSPPQPHVDLPPPKSPTDPVFLGFTMGELYAIHRDLSRLTLVQDSALAQLYRDITRALTDPGLL